MPKQAKTQVSVGGIHQLPVLTRLGSAARPAGTGVAGARFSGDLTGFGPGRGSWACGWGSDRKSLWHLPRLLVLRWAAASCFWRDFLFETSCLKQEVILDSGTGSGLQEERWES